MTISTPTKLYEGTYTGALGPSTTHTLTAGAPVGARVWLFYASECGDTAPQVPTLNTTDSKGNTWTTWRAYMRNAATGATIGIYSSTAVLTSALVADDTITITNPNADWAANRIGLAVAACTGVDGIDQTASTDPGSTSSPSVGPVSLTGSQIIWGVFGMGVRAATPGANFTEFAEVATAVGSADRQLYVEYRIVNSSGSYSAPASLASSTTVVGAMGTWKDAAPAATTPGVYMINDVGVWVPADMHFL